ncbi:MAG: M50 family metallopeptidase [Bacteroidales bacterium]|nr:M50 family metallopeptidase [Bacteroidales bacterium]
MKLLKLIYYPVILLLIVLSAMELWPALGYAFENLDGYRWFGAGILGYFLLRLLPLWRKNEDIIETFTHEFTHMLVGMMFFHKIHGISAEDRNGGAVIHSGRLGNIFIALSPYCFPVFTYFLMALGMLGAAKQMYVFDLLIGLSAAFHTGCFARQTRLYQTDIQGQGYVRSFLFLAFFWMFNLTVILLDVRKGLWEAVLYIFQHYWSDAVALWNMVF